MTKYHRLGGFKWEMYFPQLCRLDVQDQGAGRLASPEDPILACNLSSRGLFCVCKSLVCLMRTQIHWTRTCPPGLFQPSYVFRGPVSEQSHLDVRRPRPFNRWTFLVWGHKSARITTPAPPPSHTSSTRGPQLKLHPSMTLQHTLPFRGRRSWKKP